MDNSTDIYRKYYMDYRKKFSVLFRDAFQKSSFDFILSIISIRSEIGYNQLVNTDDIIIQWCSQKQNLPGIIQSNIALWIYCNVIECNELYETLANLVYVALGNRFSPTNLYNKKMQILKLSQKVDRINRVTKDTQYRFVYDIVNQSIDTQFRNAIDHADYYISTNGVHAICNEGVCTYTHNKLENILNRALALYTSLRYLQNKSRKQLSNLQYVMSSKEFGNGRSIKMKVIVRENDGIVGLSGEAYGRDFDSSYPITIACVNDDEAELIEKHTYKLPARKDHKWKTKQYYCKA